MKSNWEVFQDKHAALCCIPQLILSSFTFLLAGYSDSVSAGCKQFTVGFAALEDSSSTATAEIAVNGMDPPELGFPPAEPTKGTSGQSHRLQAGKIEARV